MAIDWIHFTPLAALAGGLLIGLGAALLLLCDGRIAGVSGILGGLLRAAPGERIWRLAFLGGLLLAAPLWRLFTPLPAALPVADGVLLVAAGLLVGVGTRVGSGCTSGHGVCGIARASPRSMTATALFVAAGVATVFLIRHGG
ncbi:hypothetical protein IP91_04987 [Pseudoduganella lurida]|uniref:YeeE/YedE family protein n=1 Tax=Pseudoduganella lurida TaxID=1036180 RepID=A0A562QVH8_9BURK|nr:YeeE/YedE family protein [Pseudoduganella lurida]TWI60792.1 hypothetical protein IP91_04987 [Pseudoduganella lurida]